MEQNYEFRKKLNIVHKPNRRNMSLQCAENEISVCDCWQILIDSDASPYVAGIASDLQDYLFTSMNVSVMIRRKNQRSCCTDCEPTGTIRLTVDTAQNSLEPTTSRSYKISVQAGKITVTGFGERGIGQGCYYIEDLMNLREAPFLPVMEEVRKPLFSPRMIHSGYIMDQFPNPHLNAIAHAGLDTVLLFVSGVNQTPTAYVDINDLIERADSFGLDVYLYSYLISEKHPDDPDAEEYYENSYGALIKAHPKAKGIIFVGESCEFPSKDPHTTGRLSRDAGINLEHKISPGWWPCTDYPDWLNMLKRIMWKYNPDLDIVFWTYNWGWAPEEDRLALIRQLPTDVSLQATFEMFEDIEKDGIMTRCADYTVSFEGPGTYFSTEAQAAHERNLRLYAMANTGGLTWDIGVIPYQPIPFQWKLRYDALLKAQEDWGLAGLMESHHFGWWPSFVSELAKWSFWAPEVNYDEMVMRIAKRDFSAEAAALVVDTWKDWSAAWKDYVVTNEDQYGAFRVGPSYPFFLDSEPKPLPKVPYAHFGSDICMSDYVPHDPSIVSVEADILQRMKSKWCEGLQKLEKAMPMVPETKQDNALRMLNLGRFVANCIQTTINIKQWWQLKDRLKSTDNKQNKTALLQQMKDLLDMEMENVKATIPLVELDSRLGWEPSMEYMTDREHLEWKISVLEQALEEIRQAAAG